MAESIYHSVFYKLNQPGSLQSARIVVPLVLELVHPKSVVDFGCGTGTWLKAFMESGIVDIMGLDGDYVDRSQLLISQEQFVPTNFLQHFNVGRRFDLAVSLEVAEHIPTRMNRDFVSALTKAAPVILFSAACPGQGGEDHRNCQWPRYWQSLFGIHGFRRLDPIRHRILRDCRVESWYRQNIYLYVSERAIADSRALQEEEKATARDELEVIYSNILARYQSPRGLLRELPGALMRSLTLRLLKQRASDAP
jgi:SAM-dependent methyltransferase